MVTLSDIRAAAREIDAHVLRTPLLCSDFISHAVQAEVYLKLENLQRTGSFKPRGAAHKLVRAARRGGEIGDKGVVAASAGNHAQGVSLAARELGMRATIVMPENASLTKQLATKAYGGEVVLCGASVADSLERAKTLEADGYYFVHPFDDDEVIAGQGTVGLEILADLPDVDEVWVPVGGGGLLAGVAVAVKETAPRVRVVGVQARACPSALEARRAGRPTLVSPTHTIADGIAVARVGARPFEILSQYVDELLTVSEEEIATAMLHLLERKKLLAEGAGAVPLAALLSADPAPLQDRRIALVVSGGNVDLNILDRILERGLIESGRIMRFGVVLRDVPGTLFALLGLLSREKANVLHIFHDRLGRGLAVGETRVEIELETRGADHIRRLSLELEAAGFQLQIR